MSILKTIDDYRTKSFQNFLITNIVVSTFAYLLGYAILGESILTIYIVFSSLGVLLLPSELKKYKYNKKMNGVETKSKVFYLAFIGGFIWFSGFISWLIMKDTMNFPFAWTYLLPFAYPICAFVARIAEVKGHVNNENGFDGFGSGYLTLVSIFMFTFWCLYDINFMFAYWFVGRPLIAGLCILYHKHEKEMPFSIKVLLNDRMSHLSKEYLKRKSLLSIKKT